MVQERFEGKEEVYAVRRPVFRLEIDNFWVQDLTFPTVVIPGEKAAATLHLPPPCLEEGQVVHALCSLDRAGRSRELPPKVGGQLELPQNKPLPKSCFYKRPFLWHFVLNLTWQFGLLWQ